MQRIPETDPKYAAASADVCVCSLVNSHLPYSATYEKQGKYQAGSRGDMSIEPFSSVSIQPKVAWAFNLTSFQEFYFYMGSLSFRSASLMFPGALLRLT